ncbi:MAG: alpha/beta fold hydrolase [Planctomycetes bacterium]|nr:alpha/beta fold hydrolase [Planctomycetota bacterium]
MCRAAVAAAIAATIVSAAAAGELPAFRVHTLNADSTYSACAAFDVNRDGRIDVVSGGFWYEAPTFERRFLRNVQEIRGRYDDYSNLPLDVNGDGWTDLVSANYRSQSLYWVEHPGERLVAAAKSNSFPEWPVHKIAEPGPMETGRLVDVDGDGMLDILPNGTNFAAWWELVRGAAAGDGNASKFEWKRHELPQELAGHGIGFGDIDGDGRGDAVGPSGWAQAPADPRRERWLFHPEFRLHRDAGIPILVVDVDRDGDNDIIWARGHHVGLYWLEQRKKLDAADSRLAPREWTFHAIDTSWSQAHSLLWEDLGKDGRPELIAGKRWLGHDGKDIGEYDPMIVCQYHFDPLLRTWGRRVLAHGNRVGFGLDPKAADLDGDGDLDLICPGRSGLYWLENLFGSGFLPEGPGLGLARAEAPPSPPGLRPVTYDDHQRLMVVKEDGKTRPVASPSDWSLRRAHVLAAMQEVMGHLPGPLDRAPLNVEIVSREETPQYIRYELTYSAEQRDRVAAWLLVPLKLTRPAPAMLCLHQTTPLGKDEPAGFGGAADLHYAHELAVRGYVCLAPDYPGFGDSRWALSDHRGRYGDGYASGTMKAIWNNIRALDLLESLPEVDRDRIGVVGHSLGGHNAIFTAAFDRRIAAVVCSSGFTAFSRDDIASWTGPRYMPRIRERYGSDAKKIPFDFHEVLAALAPVPVFVSAPEGDADFDVEGVREVVKAAREVYGLWKADDALVATYPNGPHGFPHAARTQAWDWLDGRLRR